MRDDLQVRRKKLATIDVVSWTETDDEGKPVSFAALELWLDGEREDEMIFGPSDNEDDPWDTATSLFWESSPSYLLDTFLPEE